MGRTVIGQVVGYCMGNTNDFRSGGLPHLQSEILSPFVRDLWFRTEPERDSEKGLFEIFLGLREVRYSQRVGFCFPYGFDAISICIEMGCEHLASPHGVPEIWEPLKKPPDFCYP